MSQAPNALALSAVRLGVAFLAAFAVTHLLASFFYAQLVLAGLESVGVAIPLETRIDMIVATTTGLLDSALGGLFNSYGRAIFVGLMVAFPIAYVVKQLITPFGPLAALKPIAYPAAGAATVALVLYFVALTQGPGALAGARDAFGILLQLAAGAAGGGVFALLRPRPNAAADAEGRVFGLAPPWAAQA